MLWVILPVACLLTDAIPNSATEKEVMLAIEEANILSETNAIEGEKRIKFALNQLKELDNNNLKAKALHTSGIILRKLGRYQQAEKDILEAQRIFSVLGDKKELANSHNTMGLVYSDLGSYSKALEEHLQALEIRRTIDDRQGMAFSYNNLGNLYRNTAEFDKALDYLHRSLTLKEEFGDKMSISYAHNNLGNTYRRMNHFEKAREHYQKALDLRKELGETIRLAGPLKNLGTLYEEQGKLEEALDHYQQSLAIWEEQGNRRQVAGTLNNVGRIYIKQKKPEQALETLFKAKNIAEITGVRVVFMETYGLLSDAYASQGDYRTALDYYKKHSDAFRDLFNERNSAKLMELQLKFDTKEKEQAIEYLEGLTEAQNREKAWRNRLTIAIGMAVLSLLLVFWNKFIVVARSRKQLMALSEALEEKSLALEASNQELETLATSDSLTGLANRRAFDEQLFLEWKKCKRTKQPFTLLMIDIDHFKIYNDTFGHQAGDHCLQEISSILRHSITRSGDFLCRFGGEEFAAILFATDLTGVKLLSENIRSAVESAKIPHSDSVGLPYVTISIGAAQTTAAHLISPEHLIQAADEALYSAKNQGRNQVIVTTVKPPQQAFSS